MKPDSAWIADWRIGEAPSREGAVARALLRLFVAFWDAEDLSQKSKTTQQRHAAALHALGGHLVEQAIAGEGRSKSARELLRESVESEEGPLISHDDERWQREIDTVCRKLHRHLAKTR